MEGALIFFWNNPLRGNCVDFESQAGFFTRGGVFVNGVVRRSLVDGFEQPTEIFEFLILGAKKALSELGGA